MANGKLMDKTTQEATKMREARCRGCGARYSMQTEKMPKAMKCFCESRDFKLV